MTPTYQNSIFLLFIAVLAAVVLGIAAIAPSPDAGAPESALTRSNRTDVAELGTITIDRPGQEPGTPHLLIEEGPEPRSAPLAFDALSACVTEAGATVCTALSLHALAGRQALVEGEQKGDRILVRKLRLIGAGDLTLPTMGNEFIAWADAVALLERCTVASVAQTHALDVDLELRGGARVRAVEPSIDEIFRVLERTTPTCGRIPVATE